MPPRLAEGALVAHRYQLLQPLARGGNAVVWTALDRLDGTPVVLKWALGRSSASVLRAQREASILRLLRVAGVVPLRAEGVDRGRSFVVLDRVAGHPFPTGTPPSSWHALRPLVVSVLRTLRRVHTLGFVHGDLKPDNVLVDGAHAMLIDFGAARSFEADGTSHGNLETTRAYAPPEVLDGKTDPRSDLYALAVMVHAALTGRFPFRVTGSMESVLVARGARPPRVRWARCDDLPPAAQALWTQALSPNPDDRPESAEAVLRALGEDDTQRMASSRTDAVGRYEVDALRLRFVGDGLLQRLPEDAAALLHARTGGDPDAVERELAHWTHLGLARPLDGRYLVTRSAIERLLLAVELTPPGLPPSSSRLLAPQAREVLAWLSFAGVPLRVEVLSALCARSPSSMARLLRGLRHDGVVMREARARYGLVHSGSTPHWSPAQRDRAHERLVDLLHPGEAGRLRHALVAATRTPEAIRELLLIVGRHAEEGRLAAATELLREGVRSVAARSPSANGLVSLFATWIDIAIDRRTLEALDECEVELLQRRTAMPALGRLVTLVRAAKARIHWHEGSLRLARSVRPFDEPHLDELRLWVRALAARRASLTVFGDEVRKLRATAATTDAWQRRLRVAEGHLAYESGAFKAAAWLYLKAVRAETQRPRRVHTLLAAAAALLEVGAFERAERCTQSALDDAVRLRMASAEGRARWLLRVLAWRRFGTGTPDPSLVEAALGVDPDLARIMVFHDATLAWNARDTKAFDRLLGLSLSTEGVASDPRTRGLLLAMAHDLGLRPMADAARAALIEEVATRVPSIALQVAALLGGGIDRDTALRYARTVPRHRWPLRLDVLSIDASLARL